MRRTVTVPWAYRAFLTVLTGDPHHIGFGKVSRPYARSKVPNCRIVCG